MYLYILISGLTEYYIALVVNEIITYINFKKIFFDIYFSTKLYFSSFFFSHNLFIKSLNFQSLQEFYLKLYEHILFLTYLIFK